MSITIFSQDGEGKQYELLSERYPRFLEQYPVSEGFYVHTKVEHILDHNPAYSDILSKALEIDFAKSLVFLNKAQDMYIITASLMKNDKVIQNRTAKGVCQESKELEALETSSVQRLVASLGFDGTLITQDELMELEENQTCYQTDNDSNEPVANTTDRKIITPVTHLTPVDDKYDDVIEPSNNDETTASTTEKTEDVISSSDTARREDIGLKNVLRTIKHQAKLKGYTLPSELPDTYETGRKLLSEILQTRPETKSA